MGNSRGICEMVEIITGPLPETVEEREGKMVIKERNQKDLIRKRGRQLA
jgi:hypothetical protein